MYISGEDRVWYVCDVLYAVLYVSVCCFVVRGCGVSRRYIDVCSSSSFVSSNRILPFVYTFSGIFVELLKVIQSAGMC